MPVSYHVYQVEQGAEADRRMFSCHQPHRRFQRELAYSALPTDKPVNKSMSEKMNE